MRRLSTIANVCLLATVSLATPGAHAQEPTVPYTLRENVREVVIDVVVTDRNGRFVGGLSKGDFAVLEDKQKQRITAFQPPATHLLPVNNPAVQSSSDLTKIGTSPVTMLVLDELNTQFTDMAFARKAMEKWLQKQPARLSQPTVLLVASDEKFAALHDYTQDRDALLTVLQKHFPSYPYRLSKGGAVGPDAAMRMAMSLGTLVQIAQASTGTPGRKNVIWVGVGFPSLSLNDVTADKEKEIKAAAASATSVLLKARVTLNVIDPMASTDSSLDLSNPEYLSLDMLQSMFGPTSDQASGILTFDAFAPATGGKLYAGRNDVDAEITQAVDNGSNYYTIAYVPSNHDDNPAKFRNIAIVMRDSTLRATTRTGYFVPARRKEGERLPAPPTHQLAFDLTNAGLSSMVYNGLQVAAEKSVTGYVLHVASAGLEPHVLTTGRQVDEVTVMEVDFKKNNTVARHQVQELKVALPADTLSPSTVDYAVPVDSLPKDTARIRFVVRDAVSGHIGTVDVLKP
jgi:VWFA-related protein